MRRRTRKKKTLRPFFLTVGIGAALLVSGLVSFWARSNPLISAYGVRLCGTPHHIVLIYRDGTQRIVKGPEAIAADKEVAEAVEMPADRTSAVNLCPAQEPPRVF